MMRFLLRGLLLSCLLAGVVKAESSPPNIVFILADDLGWADVGFNSKRGDTPNLDRLAAEGLQLDQFYVAPMCSPTRAAFMTGRYPIRFGLARAVIPPWRHHGLPPEEETLPERLAEAGYGQRGIFGKWHLGHHDPKWHPLNHGFTHFEGHYNGAIDYFTKDREGQPDWHINWEPVETREYATDIIAQSAADWITKAAAGDAPYFCYVPFNAPHSPFDTKEADMARYAHLKGDQKRKAVAAMTWSMDEGIGKILEAIEASGESDNTMVWFSSDNGGIRGIPNNNKPLHGDKLDVHEGGVRVAACARWPAGWPGGRKISEPIGIIDVLPTLLATAGVEAVGSEERPLDGRDVGPVLSGAVSSLPDRDLYSYHGQSGPEEEKIAIRNAEWKLIVLGPELTESGIQKGHEVELYRIATDPFESANLAANHPEVVQELARKLIEFRALQPENAVPTYSEGRTRDFVAPEKWRILPE